MARAARQALSTFAGSFQSTLVISDGDDNTFVLLFRPLPAPTQPIIADTAIWHAINLEPAPLVFSKGSSSLQN